MNQANEILDDSFIPEWNNNIKYQYASTWKRLTNYIIDACFVFIVFYILLLCYDFISARHLEAYINPNHDRLFFVILYIVYYSFSETYFKGRTIGKIFTKTKAITIENTNLKIEQAIIRSAGRLIPLDHLSFLFGDDNNANEYSIGWHDKISKTRVIDLKLPIRNTDEK